MNNFKKVLRKNPEHTASLVEYATTLSFEGDFEKAKKYFKHALKLEPNNIIANLRLGKIFQQKFLDYAAAIDCYKKIIEVDPNYYKAHY